MRTVGVHSISIASGVTFSSVVNLGKAYSKISIVLPSMVSGTDVRFLVSPTSDGDYKRFFHQPTITSAAVSFTIASSISDCVVPLPNFNVQYLKIEHSSATTVAGGNAYTYHLICAD